MITAGGMAAGVALTGGIFIASLIHHSDTPVPPELTMPPAASASASACVTVCPGYVPPDDSYHPAPMWLYAKPIIPTNADMPAIAVPVVITPTAPSQAVSVAPRATTQPSASKAGKAPKQSKQSKQKAPKQQKAPKAPKAPKQQPAPVPTAQPMVVVTQ